MIICLVVFKASERGGFCWQSDFGPGFGPVWVAVGLVGVCVMGVISLFTSGLFWRRRVTRMNADVAEA